jgi:hypothetical protein
MKDGLRMLTRGHNTVGDRNDGNGMHMHRTRTRALEEMMQKEKDLRGSATYTLCGGEPGSEAGIDGEAGGWKNIAGF